MPLCWVKLILRISRSKITILKSLGLKKNTLVSIQIIYPLKPVSMEAFWINPAMWMQITGKNVITCEFSLNLVICINFILMKG